MLNDAFDDVGTAPQLAGAFLEVFSARTRTIEHFGRRNIVNRSANRAIGVQMQIGKGAEFLAGLMVGQRIIHNGVLGDVRQRDVVRHVLQVRPVALAHEKKLAAVAKNSGANAGLFEPAVLLDNRDVPAIEFAKLGVAFPHDFFAAWNVQKPGDFFIHVPFPEGSRQGDDVFAGVVGDEESRC